MEYPKVPKQIFDAVSDNMRKLESLFPSAVKDGQLDIAALKEELGQFEEVSTEKYELTWAGKQAAKRLSQTDIPGRTLKFVPKDSKNTDTTQNLYIEGDNLEVLKLLRQNYYGSVKMIYIDPPYNTGNDFVYRDNFTQSQAESDEAEGDTEDGERMIVNQKSSNRYHANWLNMLYPRLRIAKDLLRNDGVIFISIDDNEVHNLRKVCDEVFGATNCIGLFPWRKRTAKSDVPFGVSQDYEWVMGYVKTDAILGLEFERKYYESVDFPNDRWRLSDLTTQKIESQRPNSAFDLVDPKTGKTYMYNPKRLWGITKDTFWDYYNRGKIVFPDDYSFLNISIPSYRVFESEDRVKALEKYGHERPMKAISTHLPEEVGRTEKGNKEFAELLGNNIFSFPKPSSLIKHFIVASTGKENDDIILDFFSGSATTAHAVMQLNAEDGGNRQFIMIQYPEICDEKSEAYKSGYKNICEIGKERIRRAGEKIQAEIEENNRQLKLGEQPKNTPDIGFKVFRTADTNIRWTHEALKGGERDLAESMMTDKDHLDFMPNYTEVDVVYEILLRQRDIPLSARVEKLEIGERTYMFADAYVVCLDESITPEFVEELAAIEPVPIKYVFRDSAFGDDISFKDETMRRLESYIARNSGEQKKTYTVEFI